MLGFVVMSGILTFPLLSLTPGRAATLSFIPERGKAGRTVRGILGTMALPSLNFPSR